MKREVLSLLASALDSDGAARALAVAIMQAEFGTAGTERSRHIPVRTRSEVMSRDGLVCGICGDPVDPDDVHLDHIEPWSLGGDHSADNLRVAHSFCNVSRGAKVQ